MRVGHHKTLLSESLKSILTKTLSKSVEILLSHLIDHDSHDNLWFAGRFVFLTLCKCGVTK